MGKEYIRTTKEEGPQTMAELEALLNLSKEQQVNPPIVPQKSELDSTTVVPEQPKVEVKPQPESLQQFKDKDGNIDNSKIEKSNEHLETQIISREELLKKNKELLKKFTQTSQELKQTEKEVVNKNLITDNMSEEDEQVILKELEKNPVKTLRNLINEISEAKLEKKLSPINKDLSKFKEDKIDISRTEELDNLAKTHPWILTEGLGRFEKVFSERPYLTQSENPYSDAIRFMDDLNSNKGVITNSSQIRSKTPILGNSVITPPPSSAPAASQEQELDTLNSQYTIALARGNKAEAIALVEKMDKIRRGY